MGATTRRLGATRVLWFSVVVGRPVTSVNDHFGSNCPNEGAVIEGVPPTHKLSLWCTILDTIKQNNVLFMYIRDRMSE